MKVKMISFSAHKQSGKAEVETFQQPQAPGALPPLPFWFAAFHPLWPLCCFWNKLRCSCFLGTLAVNSSWNIHTVFKSSSSSSLSVIFFKILLILFIHFLGWGLAIWSWLASNNPSALDGLVSSLKIIVNKAFLQNFFTYTGSI
jgi:hypothetical protein